MKPTIESMTVSPNAREDGKKATLNQVDESSQLLSRGTTVSGQDEEAVVYSNSRMLQDPTGRLCQYIQVLLSMMVTVLYIH